MVRFLNGITTFTSCLPDTSFTIINTSSQGKDLANSVGVACDDAYRTAETAFAVMIKSPQTRIGSPLFGDAGGSSVENLTAGRSDDGDPATIGSSWNLGQSLMSIGDHELQAQRLVELVDGWAGRLSISSWDSEGFKQNLNRVNAYVMYAIVNKASNRTIEDVLLLLYKFGVLPEGELKELAKGRESELPCARDVRQEEKETIEGSLAEIKILFKTYYASVYEVDPPEERLGLLEEQLLDLNVPLLDILSKVMFYTFSPFARVLGLEDPNRE